MDYYYYFNIKISDNIELYKANLADTFNMFDSAIINGTTSRLDQKKQQYRSTISGCPENVARIRRIFAPVT